MPEFSISFSQGGNSGAHTVSGWSTPEATETWSIGPACHLRLPAPTRPADYALVMILRPHVADRLAVQHVRVVANDIEVGNFAIRGPRRRACLIPRRAIDGQDAIHITLETPDAARPADHGTNADRRRLAVALAALTLSADPAGVAQPDDAASLAATKVLSPAELMARFESLGQNCEFGLVQRKCGIEPLGLLRFSSTPLTNLLTALDRRFAGMGLVENLEVMESANSRELMIHDRQFDFLYHAWITAAEMAIEDVRHREARRVPFLIRKLIEDLENADKIFVFKGMGAVAEEEVFPLVAALRRFGANRLLFVTLADADHPAGTVEARGPGFLVGYIERFAPGENAYDFLLDQWVCICREVHRLAAKRQVKAS